MFHWLTQGLVQKEALCCCGAQHRFIVGSGVEKWSRVFCYSQIADASHGNRQKKRASASQCRLFLHQHKESLVRGLFESGLSLTLTVPCVRSRACNSIVSRV